MQITLGRARAQISTQADSAVLQADADAMLERQIERAKQAFLGAETRAARHFRLRQLNRLIGQRSPAQIARMEHERGL